MLIASRRDPLKGLPEIKDEQVVKASAEATKNNSLKALVNCVQKGSNEQKEQAFAAMRKFMVSNMAYVGDGALYECVVSHVKSGSTDGVKEQATGALRLMCVKQLNNCAGIGECCQQHHAHPDPAALSRRCQFDLECTL